MQQMYHQLREQRQQLSDTLESERVEKEAADWRQLCDWRQNQEQMVMRMKVLGVGFVSLQELLLGLSAAVASKVWNVSSINSENVQLTPCQSSA